LSAARLVHGRATGDERGRDQAVAVEREQASKADDAGQSHQSRELAQMGANILRLAREQTSPSFLTRRVESIEFLDASCARRTVKCYLRLDPFGDTNQWPREAGQLYLPLARISRRKDSHGNFDMVDETGGQLARLNKAEERGLVFAGVLKAARTLLQHDPGDQTIGALGAIVLGRQPLEILSRHLNEDDTELLELEFQAVLLEAHENFYLVAPVTPPADLARRVITYQYDEEIAITPPQRSKAARLFFTRSVFYAKFDTPAVADSQSYHVEVLAPPDLAVPHRRSELRVIKPYQMPDPPILDNDRSDRRAHFFYDGGGPVEQARIDALLVLDTTGITFSMRAAAIVASTLTALGAALAWFGPRRVFSDNIEAWVTLLIAAPAVVTAIIAIRSGHGMTSRLSRGTRLTAALPAFALFCTAVAIVATTSQWILRVVWSFAVSIAVVACIRVISERRTLRRARKEQMR
jgi:hypothetical protein